MMIKRWYACLLACALLVTLSACGDQQTQPEIQGDTVDAKEQPRVISIALSDKEIKVDGKPAGEDPTKAVFLANDVVFYPAGKDFAFGEGTETDAHEQAEADTHTVVHISQPGTYSVSGTLSAGQIAVDLGEDAEKDPNAVVTLILDGVDITCTVAPAVIFYNVYECGSKDTETASNDVDTSAAGANIIIADDSNNYIRGAYVARIYKPESVELNEEGTEVLDAKKLHKYDAAFYSKMSMNVDGGEAGTGVLRIDAENEGLDSELHLTINGGNINITSGNDGINTNEDGVSVTTVNGGSVNILVTGETGEGDGIDSNGWLVINGGSVIAFACSDSADAGIDSDMGIYINGGGVIATGNMLDRIEDGGQNYAVFQFAEKQVGGQEYTLHDVGSSPVMVCTPVNDFSVLLVSSDSLAKSNYNLLKGDALLSGVSGMGGGMMPGGRPNGMMPGGQMPEGFDPPEGMEPLEGFEPPNNMEHPENIKRPEDMEFPEGMERPERPQGVGGGRPGGMMSAGGEPGEKSTVFTISDGGNVFSGVSEEK